MRLTLYCQVRSSETNLVLPGEKYSQFRRTRPDGNCFFRAVGFRLFEQLLGDSEEWARVRKQVGVVARVRKRVGQW